MAVTGAPSAGGVENSPVLSVFLLCFGLLIFSIQDVIVRSLSGTLPVHELVFLRGGIALWLMAAFVFWRYGKAGFRIVRPGIILLRGFAGFSCFTFYYLAIARLPLADAVTIGFSSPLFICALSVPMLGERVGWRRWVAVLIGFVGVIVVVGPSGNLLDPAVLFAIAGTATYAVQTLLTRLLRDGMVGPGIAFYQMVGFILFAGLLGLLLGHGGFEDVSSHPSLQFLLRAWAIPAWEDFRLILATGFIAAAGFIMLATAYARSDASVVAPFEYSGVLWGTLAGWIFFSEVPGIWTYIGASLIVGSGLFILSRELRWKRGPRSLRNPAHSLAEPKSP